MKTEHILIRVSPEEQIAFHNAAARVGMTLSQWLRELARRAAGLPTLGDEADRK